MNDKGKKVQVLFEKVLVHNNYTGDYEESKNGFQLWTEPNLEELIRNISGVCHVIPKFQGFNTSYGISIDPRYDIEYVKKEIEAVIICEIGEV